MKYAIPWLLATAPLCAGAQTTLSEHIEKTLTFTTPSASPFVMVRNITGPVSVEGYDGSTVLVQVEKTIDGRTSADAQQGMVDIDVGVWQHGDSIAVYLENKKFTVFEIHPNAVEYRFHDCSYDNRETGYEPKLSFVIKVPANARLWSGTVNEGDLRIRNVKGALSAFNVNGAIQIDQAHEVDRAETVNGDVTVRFEPKAQPGGTFKTINGDINLQFSQDINAELTFKSMHGDLYTNVDRLTILKPVIVKTENGDPKAPTYRIERVTPVQFGDGGQHMDFETLNGDVVIKKS